MGLSGSSRRDYGRSCKTRPTERPALRAEAGQRSLPGAPSKGLAHPEGFELTMTLTLKINSAEAEAVRHARSAHRQSRTGVELWKEGRLLARLPERSDD